MTSSAQSDVGIRPPGFRMPATARPGTVRLQVADLDRSLGFYRDRIGLRLLDGRADPADRADGATDATARLGAPGSDDALVELVEKPGARPVPRRGLLGLYHFALLLPDRAALGRFIRRQTELGTPFGASDHGFSEATYLEDPDGITMEVYADRPRETWARRDREFAVRTDPLDLRAVMAAADPANAAGGIPAGSRIGHMHFYVGDLDRAERFYHAALGFDKVIWRIPTALFVSAGGYHHHVGVNTWAAGAPVATADDAGLLDWRLVLPDAAALDAAAGSLAQNGFAADRLPDGDIVAADPWGIAIRMTAA